MKILTINDLHLGVQRSGGTTPETAKALREFALTEYEKLLTMGENVLVNGDMFDTYQVPLGDLLEVYRVTCGWLSSRGQKLWLIPGNHDLSKNSANVGSFQFLAHLLMARFPDKVKYLVGGNWVDEGQGIYAVSHVPNQDLFELELARVPDNVKTIFLHCNFDNAFAGVADHSLNLMRDQAKALTKRGITVVLGHEHQGRTMMNDKVIIVGNQAPTSVADCLSHGDGQKDGQKYCLEIDGDDMELIPTWSAGQAVGGYHELDWQDLANAPQGQHFIRVTGKATAAQAADVIKVISKLRQNSAAFVITNAVKIDGAEGADEIAESVEDIRSVNVLDMLLETLDPDQRVVIQRLLAEDVK